MKRPRLSWPLITEVPDGDSKFIDTCPSRKMCAASEEGLIKNAGMVADQESRCGALRDSGRGILASRYRVGDRRLVR